MTVVKSYCDHCGKELNDMEDYSSCEIEIAYVEFQADLCKECHGLLVKMAKDFCSCQERKIRE